jgi:hypothetical protein
MLHISVYIPFFRLDFSWLMFRQGLFSPVDASTAGKALLFFHGLNAQLLAIKTACATKFLPHFGRVSTKLGKLSR